VLGVLPGVIGTIQATEAIKIILGIGEPLIGRLLIYDALRMRFREIRLRKDPECPVCGLRPTIRELREIENYCAPANGRDMTVTELSSRMDAGSPPVIIDVREPPEIRICSIPGSIPIPMADLPSRLADLDPKAEVVVYCKSGGRSSRAVAWLHERGFIRARNLTGGVLAWIDQVDPSQPKY
jgi:rhodanese-related sulfurtransferase